MNNMEIWDKVKRPPSSALKTIPFGRLKGKSDINPQWRMQIMTEVFGPCGQGWTYTIDRLWTEPGVDGQVFAFSEITLSVGQHAGIPGIGGSMLIEKDKNGLYHNDEAFKMATTDALSVALKALGVAADIYLGLWDGSKYATPAPSVASKPTDGAIEGLSAEDQARVKDACDTILFITANGADTSIEAVEAAYKLYSVFENDAKIALFGLLGNYSKLRRAMKDYSETLKKEVE